MKLIKDIVRGCLVRVFLGMETETIKENRYLVFVLLSGTVNSITSLSLVVTNTFNN